VTGAVDVGIMAGIGCVLDVCGGDGDTSLSLFGGLVDGAVIEILGEALFCLTLRDGCCEGCLYPKLDRVERGEFGRVSCLSVIDVTNGSCPN
jgi:hypothetical protein